MHHTGPTVPNKTQQYVSVDVAAEYLGCNSRTVRRMIATGEIRGFRVGKRMLRINLNDLDRLLKPIPAAREAL